MYCFVAQCYHTSNVIVSGSQVMLSNMKGSAPATLSWTAEYLPLSTGIGTFPPALSASSSAVFSFFCSTRACSYKFKLDGDSVWTDVAGGGGQGGQPSSDFMPPTQVSTNAMRAQDASNCKRSCVC